ncbi:major facilitator superfamily transporter protein [Rutstroemia sp. NJR-2017a BBW]|nr:major facilitator superfamily transporter protein [Rutstroemia sp. NJR-2017a BBW]
MEDKNLDTITVEHLEGGDLKSPARQTLGTVQLLDSNTIVLIPTPSPDPKDPLNLPNWHKWVIIVLVAVYSAFSVLATSGLGGVFPEVEKLYPPSEATRATDLLTYPTLFMGIGNLLSMPLSITFGRRPVFLLSLITFVAASIWCACAKDLSTHIAGRDVLSMAAGQSEALAPMIVQEIHFLHQRGARVAWFVGIQVSLTAIGFMSTTYIVSGPGLGWWYGILAIISAVTLILSYFFLVETTYDRPADANEGAVHLQLDREGNVDRLGEVSKVVRLTTADGVVLDHEKFGPRTWKHNLKIFHLQPNWKAVIGFYKDTFQGLILPSMLWLLLLNGAFLGVYVFQVSTFSQVLVQPPYSFKSEWLGFVQMAQIITCMVMLPLLGYGSDLTVKLMSKLRKGIYEPEYRLIALVIPSLAVVISCVIFGKAAASPTKWSWAAIVVPYHLGYFGFLGANLVGITYVVDSFQRAAGPLLLLICAGRGFISFALGYSTVPLVSQIGYDGGMNIYAIICGALSVLGIPIYFFGKRIRQWATKHYTAKE